MSEQASQADNQNGFSLVLIVVAVAVCAAIGFVGFRVASNHGDNSVDQSRSNTQQAEARKADNSSEADLVLQNLGLKSLDSIAIDMYAAKDYKISGHKGFYIFGDPLPGEGNKRSNPNFEYASIKSGTEIIASIDGIVAFIKEQPDTKDYEVFLQPKENSAWVVGYDHLVNLNVKKGDPIKAGARLGEAAKQNNGLLRFEIQINKELNGTTTHYCPTALLSKSASEKYTPELKDMMQKWETVTGIELYDIDKQSPIGCTKTTMSLAEAEGR